MQRWELRQKVANLAVEHLSRHCSEASVYNLIQVLGMTTAWLGQHCLCQENPCYQEGCPVDCLWDDWSEWTECSGFLRSDARKHALCLGQTDAFLGPGTSCGSNVSLWVSSQFIVTESHLFHPCLCRLLRLLMLTLLSCSSFITIGLPARQQARAKGQ